MAKVDKTIRLPYHRAPFYFAPEFLVGSKEWSASFESLARSVLLRKQISGSIEQRNDFEIVVAFGPVSLSIEAISGTFWLDNFEGDNSLAIWTAGNPQTFLRNTLASSGLPRSLRPIIESAVAPFVEELITEMDARFERALILGYAQIEGRLGSRMAPFEIIDPQDRQHLQITGEAFRDGVGVDGRLDDARYDTSEWVYSYCVVPTNIEINLLPEREEGVFAAKGRMKLASCDGRRKHDWGKIWKATDDEYQLLRRRPNYNRAKLYEEVAKRFEEFPVKSEFYKRLDKKYHSV